VRIYREMSCVGDVLGVHMFQVPSNSTDTLWRIRTDIKGNGGHE
jgi:hypothetical protein